MEIEGSVALVTGANRGLGLHIARELLDRGAKVYATARDPRAVDLPGATVLRLDVTDQASVDAAAEQAGDVSLLVNNAGLATFANLVDGDLDAIRLEMDTHFFGTLRVTRAFAPVLARNGGGAIANLLSVLSWITFLNATSYSAAKAAQWSLTNGVRLELAGQGTVVSGVHLGAADTDMMTRWDVPKLDPAFVAAAVVDGIACGDLEILVDEAAKGAKAALSADVRVVYPQLP
ncbi:SDR family oxidoreductase [Dactylosporangium aurantiacum]|uniref:SDR family oxidoreductase n=1 Tax=Dactylosporangium aurantiacum TaxID=35754 RepID=A0A9Q9ME04_9ACTN|nr:SDR family oxidoreductase [Dactylosporangium aurantiacum]MDG6106728.1 SDR family oxidoreductase [Dactylosporangium aurantiacum]UWZ50875.1 SDR family oxidoreductase [Dactylosporangium aurantiacum]